MWRIILLFLTITPTITAQNEFWYGVKGGITRASYLVVDEGDWRGLHGHRNGVNCGLFLKFNKYLMTDLSFVQKGGRKDQLNYISFGGYLCLPKILYPFIGLHYDFLKSKLIGDGRLHKPTVRRTNWSYSIGIGYQEIKIGNQNFLIETKLDWVDQTPSVDTHDEDFTILKNVSVDLKIGWYFKSNL
ncbi:hypothetical protein F9K33_16255 [bacterium]|nr:MAG: hypothetical protein F9K33_16255 [bacterium]